MEFEIRNIEKHHKEDIYKLIEELNQADNLSYSLTSQWLDYIIDHVSGGIFLGFSGERLAGLGTCILSPVYKDQAALNVVVSPGFREKGLGGLLYNKVYNFAKKENVKIVETYLKERLARSLSFAEQRGFRTAMYSWEMEIKLKDLDFTLEKVSGLKFRKAKVSDDSAYKALILDGFGDELEDHALENTLKDPSIKVYILEKQDHPIGTATVQFKRDLELAYIYDIATLSDHRGQGLGSYLLRTLLMDLKQEAIDMARLSVTGENKRALDLYKHIGFREFDIDLIMTKII